jgi:hypothetical protein
MDSKKQLLVSPSEAADNNSGARWFDGGCGWLIFADLGRA